MRQGSQRALEEPLASGGPWLADSRKPQPDKPTLGCCQRDEVPQSPERLPQPPQHSGTRHGEQGEVMDIGDAVNVGGSVDRVGTSLFAITGTDVGL